MNTISTPLPLASSTLPGATGTGPVVGVRTTRIYCRLICRPSRAPKPENCVPFLNAEAARAARYRACKQCRPDDEVAPLSSRLGPSLAIQYECGPSPLGFLLVATTAQGICAIYLLDSADPSPALDRLRRDFLRATITADPDPARTLISRVVAHIVEGQPCADLALDLRGTPFQLKVWDALRAIPHGTTTTYGTLARNLGLPVGAARAVGAACGANPVSLIVPCHRVIGAGGGLCGYYWGTDRKRALLELEGVSV